MLDTPKPVSSPQRPATWRQRWTRRAELEVCCPYCGIWLSADSETVTQGKYSSAYARCQRDGRVVVSLEESLQGPDVETP